MAGTRRGKEGMEREGRGRERKERGREGGEVDSDAQLEQGRRLAKAGPGYKMSLQSAMYDTVPWQSTMTLIADGCELTAAFVAASAASSISCKRLFASVINTAAAASTSLQSKSPRNGAADALRHHVVRRVSKWQS